MRAKFTLPCLLTLLAAVILGVGPQRGGAQQFSGVDPAKLFHRMAKGRDYVLFSEVKGRRELEVFAWENQITDGVLDRNQFVKYMNQREGLQKRLRDAWDGDHAELFRLLALGRGYVPFSELKGTEEAELFAIENYVIGDQFTRDQFLKYMAQRNELRQKINDMRYAELFKRYDTNGDGYLDEAELAKTQVLKHEWQKWDANRDGRISLAECQAFLRDSEARQNGGPRPAPKAATVAEPARKIVVEEDEAAPPLPYHAAGKLPAGLPPWFTELDKDKDGQVSLYEWNQGKGGKDLDLFEKMDRNGDGYVTVEEMLYYNRFVEKGGKKDARKLGG